MISSWLLAFLSGILNWLGNSGLGYGLTSAFGSPIMTGLIFGAIYGDIPTGLIIGASIQLIYLGMIAPGNNVPADSVLAGVVAIPVALELGLAPEAAVTVAVPVAVLGVLLNQLRRTIMTVWIHQADRYAEEGDDRKLWIAAFWKPNLTNFVVRFFPAFFIGLYGVKAIEFLLNKLPSFIVDGFAVAGGILPALGFAIVIMIIGKKRLMPYFFIGYFLVAYLKIDVMAAAIFSTCIAIISYYASAKKEELNPVEAHPVQVDETVEESFMLTKSDLAKTHVMWFFSTELSNSFERLQALSFMNALRPRLRKLYKDDEEGYRKALKRHLQFYNSEGTVGMVIHGITLSMEEEKAKGYPVPGEVITSVKTGLMGPLAGIGDTLIWGTLKPIIFGIACSFALNGNAFGALFLYLYPLIMFIIMRLMLNLGYYKGKRSVLRLIKEGVMNRIIDATSLMGLFTMGALSSTYIKVKTPIVFEFQNAQPIALQDVLDQIAPGLLPLAVIFLIYWYFKNKGQKYNLVVLFILIISMVLSALGILG